MFKFFLKISDERDTALALYSEAIRQARTPLFYERCGVADTPDGRFDMIMVHVYLVLRRLKGGDERCKVLAQTLFDIMFDDMDQNLREMGAGDIGVAYRVKDMVKSGGEWISSIYLEDIALQHEHVSEAAAIGIADEKWGERPLVLVVPRQGKLKSDAVRDKFLQASSDGLISKWAVPDQVKVVDSIQKTSVGKIDKKYLRSQFIENA